MIPAIFARPDDNLFGAVTPTSNVAPLTSYALATFLQLNPATRIRFGATGLTLTWTLASPARGDVFVLPMSNLAAGTVTLTNAAGLSQAITVPVAIAGTVPETAVCDLTVGTPLDATRTSDVWHLVIAGNAANVILGGAIALYGPKRSFASIAAGDNFQAAHQRSEKAAGIEAKNEYLSRFRQSYGTRERTIAIKITAKVASVSDFTAWYRSNAGAWGTSLFWPDPAINDAYLGSWPETFTVDYPENLAPGLCAIAITFSELSKGKAL